MSETIFLYGVPVTNGIYRIIGGTSHRCDPYTGDIQTENRAIIETIARYVDGKLVYEKAN